MKLYEELKKIFRLQGKNSSKSNPLKFLSNGLRRNGNLAETVVQDISVKPTC